MRFLAVHMLCDLAWYVPAGSCIADRIGQSPYDREAPFTNATEQRVDFFTAFNALPKGMQKLVRIVIERGVVGRDGDPGGTLADGNYVESTAGALYDDRDAELYWGDVAHRLNMSWQDAAEFEWKCWTRMARSLGWEPIESRQPGTV